LDLAMTELQERDEHLNVISPLKKEQEELKEQLRQEQDSSEELKKLVQVLCLVLLVTPCNADHHSRAALQLCSSAACTDDHRYFSDTFVQLCSSEARAAAQERESERKLREEAEAAVHTATHDKELLERRVGLIDAELDEARVGAEGMAQAMNDLRANMNALSMQLKQEQGEACGWKHKYEEVAADLHGTKREADELQDSDKQNQDSLSDMRSQVDILTHQREEDTSKWEQQQEALQLEIDSLKRIRTKAAKQVMQANEEVTRLEDELDASREECGSWRRAADDAETSLEQEKELRGAAVADMEEVARDMGMQRANGEHSASVQLQQLERQVERLEAQVTGLEEERKKLGEENTRLADEVAKGEEALQRSEEEAGDKSAALQEKEAALRKCEEALQTSDEELLSFQEELLQSEAIRFTKEGEIGEKCAAIEALESTLSKLTQEAEEREQAKEQAWEQERVGLAKAREQASEQVLASMERVQVERDTLQERLQRSDERASQRESGLTEQQVAREELQRENEELHVQVKGAVQTQLQAAEASEELQREIEQLHLQMKGAVRELEESHSCTVQEIEQAHSQAEAAMKAREKEHAAAMKAMQEEHSAGSEKGRAQLEEVSALVTENETLRSRCDEWEAECGALETQSEEVREVLRRLEEESYETAEEHTSAMSAMQEEHQVARSAGSEKGRAQLEEVSALVAENETLRSRCNEWEAECGALETQSEEVREVLRRLEEESCETAEQHTSVMSAMQEEHSTALDTKEEEHSMLVAAKEGEHLQAVEELQEELRAGLQVARSVGSEKGRAQEQVEELHCENETLRSRCDEWEAECGAMKTRSEEAREELRRLEEESCETAEERGVMRGKLEFAEESLQASEEKVARLEESRREALGVAEAMAAKGAMLEQELSKVHTALQSTHADFSAQLTEAHAVQMAIPFLQSKCGVALLSRVTARWQQSQLLSAWRRWHDSWSHERFSLQAILSRWNNVERSLLSSGWQRWSSRVREVAVESALLAEVEVLRAQCDETEALRAAADEAKAEAESAGAESAAAVEELTGALTRVKEEAKVAAARMSQTEEMLSTNELSTSEVMGQLREQLAAGAARSEELESYASECRSAALRLVVQRWRTRTVHGKVKQAWRAWHHGCRKQCTDEHQQELRTARAQCERARADCTRAEDERDALEAKVNDGGAQRESLVTSQKALEVERDELRSQLEQLDAQCERARADCARVEDERDTLEAKVDAGGAHRESLATGQKALEAERDELRSQLEQLEAVSSESAEERGVLRGKLEFAEEALRVSEGKVFSLEASRQEAAGAAETMDVKGTMLEQEVARTRDELAGLREESEEVQALLQRNLQESQLRLANRATSGVLSRWRQWQLQSAWRRWTAVNSQQANSAFEALVRSLREEVKQLSDYCHACEREEQSSREEHSQMKSEMTRLKRSNHDFARDLGVARGKLERTVDSLTQADAKRAEAEVVQHQLEQTNASNVELLEKFSERTHQFEHCLSAVYRQVSAGYEYQDGSQFGMVLTANDGIAGFKETSFREIGVAVQFLLSRFGVTLISRVVSAWRTRSIVSAWRQWQSCWRHQRTSLRTIVGRWTMLERTFLSSAFQRWRSEIHTESVASELRGEIESLRTQCATNGSDNLAKIGFLEASKQASAQQVEDLQRQLMHAQEEVEEAESESSKWSTRVQEAESRDVAAEARTADVQQQLEAVEERLEVATAELANCRTVALDLERTKDKLSEREAGERSAEAERDCLKVLMAKAERQHEKATHEMAALKTESEQLRLRQQQLQLRYRLRLSAGTNYDTDTEDDTKESATKAEQERMAVELVRLKQQALCIPLLRKAAAAAAAAAAELAQRRHRRESEGDEREGNAGRTDEGKDQHRQQHGGRGSAGGDNGLASGESHAQGGGNGGGGNYSARDADLVDSDSSDGSNDSVGDDNSSSGFGSGDPESRLSKNKQLRRKLRQLEWENSNLKAGCERLASETTGGEIRARQEAMELAGQVRMLEAELGSARDSLADLMSAGRAVDDELAQATREGRASAMLVEERETQLQQAEARLQTLPVLEAQLQEVRARLAITEEQMPALEECRSRVGQLKERNAELLEAEADLQTRLADATAEVQTLQEEVKELASEEMERFAAAEAGWAASTETHLLTLKNMEAEKDAIKAREEECALATRKEAEEHAAALSAMQEDYSKALCDKEEMHSTLTAAKEEEHLCVVEELREEVGEGREDARRVSTAKGRAQEQVIELTRESEALRDRCEERETECVSLKAQSTRLRGELQRLEEENCESAEERGVLRGKLEFAEESLQASTDKVRAGVESLREVGAKAEAIEVKEAMLEQELSKKNIALQAARTDVNRQKMMVEAERAHVKEAQTTAEDIRERHQHTLKDVKQRAAAAESQVRDLAAQVDDLEFETTRLKDQTEANEAREGRLKKRVEESDDRNRQLASTLKESEARCMALKKDVGEGEEKTRGLQASAMASQLNSLRGRWTESEAEVQRLSDQVGTLAVLLITHFPQQQLLASS
jgi:chromosome segregation ATPase